MEPTCYRYIKNILHKNDTGDIELPKTQFKIKKKKKLVLSSKVLLGKFETPLMKYGILGVNNISTLLQITDLIFAIDTETEKLRDFEVTMVKMILVLMLKKPILELLLKQVT